MVLNLRRAATLADPFTRKPRDFSYIDGESKSLVASKTFDGSHPNVVDHGMRLLLLCAAALLIF